MAEPCVLHNLLKNKEIELIDRAFGIA